MDPCFAQPRVEAGTIRRGEEGAAAAPTALGPHQWVEDPSWSSPKGGFFAFLRSQNRFLPRFQPSRGQGAADLPGRVFGLPSNPWPRTLPPTPTPTPKVPGWWVGLPEAHRLSHFGRPVLTAGHCTGSWVLSCKFEEGIPLSGMGAESDHGAWRGWSLASFSRQETPRPPPPTSGHPGVPQKDFGGFAPLRGSRLKWERGQIAKA